jgi:hypothetical protein
MGPGKGENGYEASQVASLTQVQCIGNHLPFDDNKSGSCYSCIAC